MELLSDNSSVSSYGSMPALLDQFGNIVDDVSTVTMEEPVELVLNTHLYFDEDGNECSYEEHLYRQSEREEASEAGPVEVDATDTEEEEPPWIRTPRINQKFLLKHPRVILAFLRFVDLYNELADPEEILMLKAIPQRVVKTITQHPSVLNTPPEFQEDVHELIWRLDRHADLSELRWD